MTPDLCPHCGQALPRGDGYLTPRELDVLAAWFIEGSVQKAAIQEGISEQHAKNLLSTARIRNKVNRTQQLVALHFDDVLSKVRQRSAAKPRLGEVA